MTADHAMDTSGRREGEIEAIVNNFDPAHEPLLSDPYPFYALARRQAPLFFSADLDHWVVSRYADVLEILRRQEVFSATNATALFQAPCPEAADVLKRGGWNHRSVFSSDPPYHTRFRTAVRRVFTPRQVATLEPYIRDVVTHDVNRIAPRGEADLVAESFYRMPALVILRLLGMDEDSWNLVKEGAHLRTLFVFGRLGEAEQVEVAHGLVASWGFARQLVEERLASGGDDIISELLRLRDGDDEILTLDEVTSLLLTFFSAGHETTSGLLANAFLQLLSRRDVWKDICADRGLIKGAVEEALRFDTSIVAWRRRALQDTEVAGMTIPEGSKLLLLLGAANRDETKFRDPEILDPRRAGAHDHLSFGHGLHYCLGAPLARIEIGVALEIFSTRLPGMHLAGDAVPYLPNLSFRYPLRLPVRWDVQ